MTGQPSGREPGRSGWTRRRVLTLGLTPVALAAAGAVGVELISRGVLPGKLALDTLDGACSVPSPALRLAPPGPSSSGTFYSVARRRTVGYTIAYPPGRRAGDELPLVIMLHGYGGNHADALVGMTPAQAMALRVDGRPPAAMAMVTVDGGNGYWNPHPGDDPMAMVIGELIPLCQRLGLGRPPRPVATMGISMGGYGALLLAEKYPHLITAVAAISPAIWTSYAQARGADAGAYASAAAFAANDAVTHAPALARVPVRVAAGSDDPFYPGVRALARALPAGATVDLGKGCHTDAFFVAQQPPSLAFLARHLARLPARSAPVPAHPSRCSLPHRDPAPSMGCVCHNPRLSGLVRHNPQTTAAERRGARSRHAPPAAVHSGVPNPVTANSGHSSVSPSSK